MSSNSQDNATRDWVHIRKKLYLQAKEAVLRLLAGSQVELNHLENVYAMELRQPWRAASKTELYESMEAADIILLGDFHALQQSQRSHLRLLRDWPRGGPPVVLAVEFFQARHQTLIDRYLKGKISETQFLKKMNWEKSWGFPWEHFAPLVQWAKKKGVPIYGINWGLRQRSIRSIKLRERFSAMTLEKIKSKHPEAKLVIIYGDLHLSEGQLPLAIHRRPVFKKSVLLKIFQNFEPLYFAMLKKGIESHVDLVKFRKGDFCVQSVPPWVKWQSYHLFLEQNFDLQLEDAENDLDHTDHVAQLVEFLSEEFALKVGRGGLAVYTASDSYIYDRIFHSLSKSDWLGIRYYLLKERSFYIPTLQVGFLGRLTVNHTATLAGEYLHALVSKRQKLFMEGIQDFERQIWIYAMAYFCSKIINHRRKTASVSELKASLFNDSTKSHSRKPLLIALHQKVNEISFISSGQRRPAVKKKHSLSDLLEAAKILGAMLGDKFYFGYRQGQWKQERVRSLLAVPLESENFVDFYYETVQEIAQGRRET